MTKTMIQAIPMIFDIPATNYMIVGSAALGLRYCRDIDVVCHSSSIKVETTGDEYSKRCIHNGRKIEFLLTDNDESLENLLWLYHGLYLNINEVMYILKAGHIHIGHKQEKWEKHIFDYHLLKRFVDEGKLSSYVRTHRCVTNLRNSQKTPRLRGTSVKDFFDDNVKKYYEHDLIHQLVAHKDAPMYSYMQKDESVECHKDLWDAFTEQEKIWAVLEEAYVIALERHVIPGIKTKNAKPAFPAFKWALYRICTTLTSGWFRRFAIENYFIILNMFDQVRINRALSELLKTSELCKT